MKKAVTPKHQVFTHRHINTETTFYRNVSFLGTLTIHLQSANHFNEQVQ